ncbi:hypothetical protein R4E38_06945 [Morganella morganii]|uniref:hypothetical protein n=1 Tax=Morganella morganii TaxID=582 RepID=UPI001BDB458D|nr:hypothetical protein [Morganella morganii]EJK8623002.1 hypothetical protein [Morganella morganii]EKW5727755.1 hypothetical protein [Morganella morganii]MBT0503479.1 hypothetical protein [Morganella morganii subsp. morganii]MDW7786547.1 hypothetical protein [Morganella morganii]QWM11955.1 hypothetical protein IZ182_03680 [Morganella morganii subsp. morganii]
MKDFFANLFKCTSETMIERVKNPIVGSFVFSWLFFNWKVILILLFSDKSIDDKINTISVLISYESFLFPLGFSFLYSWLLPIFSLCIDFLLKPVYSKVVSIRTDREVSEYLSREITGRKRADAELAYELQKTGGLEKIQRMQEEITASKDREGTLMKEKEDVIKEKNELLKENSALREQYSELSRKCKLMEKNNNILKNEINSLKGEVNRADSNDFGINRLSLITRIINYLNAIKIKENSPMGDVNIYFQDIILSIPKVKDDYPDLDDLFTRDKTILEFIKSLDVEQLLFLDEKLSNIF